MCFKNRMPSRNMVDNQNFIFECVLELEGVQLWNHKHTGNAFAYAISRPFRHIESGEIENTHSGGCFVTKIFVTPDWIWKPHTTNYGLPFCYSVTITLLIIRLNLLKTPWTTVYWARLYRTNHNSSWKHGPHSQPFTWTPFYRKVKFPCRHISLGSSAHGKHLLWGY